jgi:putative SOS response-associated peptidase YedK
MRGELHYTLTVTDGIGAIVAGGNVEARFNIAPGQQAPVVFVRDGARVAAQMRWGLLPRWRGHGGKRGPLVHAAPLDAVPATPLLRDAFKKQRCLALADGCYAWRELKQPIWVHPEPRHVIAFAGVWNVNDDDGEPSFAILCGPPLVTRVNTTMPIVVAPENYELWLDPETAVDVATELLSDKPLVGWRADLVSTRMSSSAHDDAQCIQPIGNPNQGELFRTST